MDMYSHMGKKQKSQEHLVRVGRMVSVGSMLIAMILAKPLLGSFDQAFQYIQEFTGFFTPGIVAIFLLAIFWKPTTANGALGAAIGSAVLSLSFKLLWPTLPFIDRVGLVFLLCVSLGMLISAVQGKGTSQRGAIDYRLVDHSTSAGFNLGSVVIILMLAGLYTVWW